MAETNTTSNTTSTTTTSTNNNKLQDKVAVITGGASGIGETTALLFSSHGARAVIIADVQDEKGQKLAETIGLDHSTYIRCDVTQEDQVKFLVDTTVSLYGTLDVFFCNAGILTHSTQTILDLDLDAFDKLMAINARGVAACVKHAARAMVEGKVEGGSIICTASTAASSGGDRSTDYTMSKCAVIGLMKCASVQLGGWGIRVNCVSPGRVATPLLLDYYKGMEAEEVEKAANGRKWLKGVLKKEHVADAVLFLASQDSAFVTGHNLVVDGGFRGA